MRKVKLLIFYFFLMMFFYSCNKNQKNIDAIYYNATIYTVDSVFSTVNAMAVKDGKIIATGDFKSLKEKYSSDTLVDLKGAFVYPGFYDAHCHFYGYGISLQNAQLSETKSFSEVLKRLKQHHETFKTEWIVGRGWDQNDWPEKKFPDKKLLDELFPDNPVVITRIDGHAVLANSAALKRANITIKTKIEGGEILKSGNELTGILLDNAADYLKSFIPKITEKEKEMALLNAQKNCFAVGLTSVCDAGLDKDIILLIDTLQKSGKLKMRINAMLSFTNENISYFLEKGIYKTNWLHVCSIKLYADGALGSRGAKLLEPYTDDVKNTGILTLQPDSMRKICELAFAYNYQVNTHAIGDSANRLTLKIYSEFLNGKNDRRWRIEHAQVVNESDFDLFGKFSIIPSVQPTHATSDMYWATDRLGEKRITGAYAYKKLLLQNLWLANGSDFPIEDINPLFGFYATVSRKDQKGFPENGFYTENALTREEALKAMTIWAAKANFEEKEKGSLEPGKFADFVVTDKNIMTVDESELFKINVLQTFINGQSAYEK